MRHMCLGYAHGFTKIQKLIHGAKGAGYAGKLTILLRDLVVAWETLLSDEALGDPDIWGRLFSLADGSDLVVKTEFDTTRARADILDLIVISVISSVTEFIRRFWTHGVGPLSSYKDMPLIVAIVLGDRASANLTRVDAVMEMRSQAEDSPSPHCCPSVSSLASPARACPRPAPTRHPCTPSPLRPLPFTTPAPVCGRASPGGLARGT